MDIFWNCTFHYLFSTLKQNGSKTIYSLGLSAYLYCILQHILGSMYKFNIYLTSFIDLFTVSGAILFRNLNFP